MCIPPALFPPLTSYMKFQVLSDSVKKRDYDEKLRKEETMAKSVCQRSHSSSHQVNTMI